jgi:uncharacterized protein YndB with AHSA1/START domain
MSEYGTYETIDGRPALRFERRFPHPVERVWHAITEPAELAHWFPAAVEVDLRPGGRMRFTFTDGVMPPSDGEVLALDPPRLFEFSWGEETLRMEVDPDGEGACLRFTHFLADRDQGARDASGWHVCLNELAKQVAGEQATAPTSEMTDELRELYAEYERRGLPSGAAMPSD